MTAIIAYAYVRVCVKWVCGLWYGNKEENKASESGYGRLSGEKVICAGFFRF